MQQYFINEKFENKNFILSKEDSFHIVKVMRKEVGSKIFIVFLESKKYICNIVKIENNIVTINPDAEVINNTELEVEITVAIPPLKSDKLDYLIQKMTELGVSNIVLFNSERNISKIKEDKIESKLNRFKKISKEASEQSKRLIIPNISYVKNISELVDISKDNDYKVVAYENEASNLENINFKSILNDNLKNKKIISIFGSEGGLSKKEIDYFIENNYSLIGLGKRILRAETAPLYFLSCVGYFSEIN